MANYELYWNTPDCKKVSTKMVVSGSFDAINDARAWAYGSIIHTSKPMVIEIFDVDYTPGGAIRLVGIVTSSGMNRYWIDNTNTKYVLKKNGKISRL